MVLRRILLLQTAESRSPTRLKARAFHAVCIYMLFGFVATLLLPVFVSRVGAANFTMQTGYYIGTGVAGLAITGLGFQPDFVMIKSSTTAGAAVYKTSAMPANTTAFTSATAVDTGTNITLDAGGFTLGTLANVNTANTLYYWKAFSGSDCSATGNFCVGTYTGNGVSPRTITTGFQPSMTMIKRSTAVAGHFRVASEPANETLFYTNTARDTAGNYIRSFVATGFTVGATDNTNTATYYYVSFATTANAFSEGTFAGNGTDDTNIGGLGYEPDFVLVKNATSATANNRRPVMSFTESSGDNSSHVGVATANQVNSIQAFQSGGFQIGASGEVNENTATIYWYSFGGAANYSSSGSFAMNTGSYTGTGASNAIGSVGFRPELVIIKAVDANVSVFRSSMMHGDSTAHMSSATANFTGGITSLDAGGFTVGTNVITNANGVVYHWQAFDGGFNPYSNSGSNDFAVGAYYGNGIDSREIVRMPWQPDMVTVKRGGATAGIWRSSANSGDSSSSFGATAETANYVQALSSTGFQVGTNATVNTAANLYYWFAFKEGANFDVGSYTGTASAQSITSAGLRAESVWVKRSTAVNGVMRAVSLAGDSTQYFAGVANAADRITRFIKNGFAVGGNQTETNASGGTYRYAAWNDADYGTLGLDIVDSNGTSVATPSFSMNSLAYSFGCTSVTGTLGEAAQRIRISNLTTSPAWSVSIAATDGATALWRNVGDTERYDFNDATGSPNGCADGGDADSVAGQLSIDPTSGTLAAESGCTTSNISQGSATAFSQGAVDSIELLTASASANPDCYWDFTDVDVSQYIPTEQPIGNYTINLTITVVAN